MLNLEEIQQLMEEDRISDKKKFARKGQDYYEGDHDIKGYRLFYYCLLYTSPSPRDA